jgi:hypothetical protein
MNTMLTMADTAELQIIHNLSAGNHTVDVEMPTVAYSPQQ